LALGERALPEREKRERKQAKEERMCVVCRQQCLRRRRRPPLYEKSKNEPISSERESNSQKHSAPATLARSPKSNRSHTIKNYPWLLMLLSLQHSLRDHTKAAPRRL